MRQTEIARTNLFIMSFRCLLRCGPPLPIPNREVKPTSADGTATAGEYVDAILRALERGPFFYALCRIVFALINELRCSSSHHP